MFRLIEVINNNKRTIIDIKKENYTSKLIKPLDAAKDITSKYLENSKKNIILSIKIQNTNTKKIYSYKLQKKILNTPIIYKDKMYNVTIYNI